MLLAANAAVEKLGSVKKPVIARSEATWQSVSPENIQIFRKGDGLPHQSADWFAMTGSIFTAP